MSNTTEKDPGRERLTKYGEKLLEAAVMVVPLHVITAVLLPLSKAVTEQPWQVLFFLVPMSGVTWLLWRWTTRRGSLRLRGPLLFFLIGYLSIFSLASAGRLLDWKQETFTVSAAQRPRQRIAPARWGDWRYLVARRDAPPRDLLVISMPTPASAVEGRFQIARLLRMVIDGGAKGIALDFYFGDETSDFDPMLCDLVRKGVPVIAGRKLELGEVTGALFSRTYADELEACWPSGSRGHLQGIRDADDRVRHVVLRIAAPDSISLSTRFARIMTGKPGLVTDTVLRFLESKPPIKAIEWDSLANAGTGELDGAMRGRFVLVGEDSRQENFRTPFGDRLGVQIHAAAITNLVSGRRIRQPPWWAGTLIIVVSCYVLALFVSEGAPRRRQLRVVAAITVLLVVLAVLAMYFLTVWLDVAYPLAAVWLLWALFLPLGRRLNPPPAQEPVTETNAV